VKDRDGEAFCDSIASSELAAMAKAERAKEIELCKDGFSSKDFGEAPDDLGDTDIGKITVKGERATAEAVATVKGKESSATWRFLKVDGQWKVLFRVALGVSGRACRRAVRPRPLCFGCDRLGRRS